jgi:hypothetical protein
MTRALGALLIVVLMAGAACEDENGTTGPAEKELDFTLSAPSSVPTKQQIEIEVHITRASLVNYPLTVTFEEANVDQPYAVVATVLLQKPEDTLARISEEAARDPLYRVTVSEAGQAAVLSVSKTLQVDVLDFP